MADRQWRSALLLAVTLTAVACSSDEAAEPAGERRSPSRSSPRDRRQADTVGVAFADRSNDELFDTVAPRSSSPSPATCNSSTAARRRGVRPRHDDLRRRNDRGRSPLQGSIGVWDASMAPTFDPSGAKSCTKLSMKVKINWNDGDDEFFGVRKLQLHSMNLDPSQSAGRLPPAARDGVAAPRSTHARVVVNGKFVGLFAPPRTSMAASSSSFNDGTGNLEGLALHGVGATDEAVCLDSLRSNEGDEGVNASLIRSLAEDCWPRTIRVGRAPVHGCRATDGPARRRPHDPSRRPLLVLRRRHRCPLRQPQLLLLRGQQRDRSPRPVDLDNAFSNILGDGNPVTPIPDGLGDITADCGVFTYGGFGLTSGGVVTRCSPPGRRWRPLSRRRSAAHERPLRPTVRPVDRHVDFADHRRHRGGSGDHDDAPTHGLGNGADRVQKSIDYARYCNRRLGRPNWEHRVPRRDGSPVQHLHGVSSTGRQRRV